MHTGVGLLQRKHVEILSSALLVGRGETGVDYTRTNESRKNSSEG